ncbi:MAG: glycosyltransferase family 2 protein [Bacteroides sp.]
MQVAVVILNWNGEALLRKFLASVVRSCEEVEAHLVIADNGSTDGSLTFLESNYPSLLICRLGQNYGFAEGYNRALQWIQERIPCDVYILLNSDVETPRGWITPLIRCLNSSQKVVAVMPKLRSYSTPQYFEYAGAAGGFLDTLGYPFCRGRIFNTTEKDLGQYNTPIRVDWASGACLAIKTEAYWAVGGLESRFWAHMEEIDLCWRLRRNGGVIYCEPRSTVYHLGGGSLPNNSPRKVYLNFRNSLLMLHRNLRPSVKTETIFFTRFLLDILAATIFLVCGKWKFGKAVLQALRDYFRIRHKFPYLPQTTSDHSEQHNRQRIRSILWQYIVRRRKYFSELPF